MIVFYIMLNKKCDHKPGNLAWGDVHVKSDAPEQAVPPVGTVEEQVPVLSAAVTQVCALLGQLASPNDTPAGSHWAILHSLEHTV